MKYIVFVLTVLFSFNTAIADLHYGDYVTLNCKYSDKPSGILKSRINLDSNTTSTNMLYCAKNNCMFACQIRFDKSSISRYIYGDTVLHVNSISDNVSIKTGEKLFTSVYCHSVKTHRKLEFKIWVYNLTSSGTNGVKLRNPTKEELNDFFDIVTETYAEEY